MGQEKSRIAEEWELDPDIQKWIMGAVGEVGLRPTSELSLSLMSQIRDRLYELEGKRRASKNPLTVLYQGLRLEKEYNMSGKSNFAALEGALESYRKVEAMCRPWTRVLARVAAPRGVKRMEKEMEARAKTE